MRVDLADAFFFVAMLDPLSTHAILIPMAMGGPVTKSSASRKIRRILVVEDDPKVRAGVRRALPGYDIVEAGTLASALQLLAEGCDLVLLDIGLPDGSGVDVAVAASKARPAPLILPMTGEATGAEGYGLSKLGAVGFLSKPFSVEQLRRAIRRAAKPDLRYRALIKTYVGRHDMLEVQAGVRSAMIDEALAVTDDNKAKAATLLGVTRQAVQKFIREKPPKPKRGS